MSKIIDICINGTDIKMKRPAKKNACKIIREFVEKKGYDWMESSVFVPHFPEKNRALQKLSGHSSLNAFG